MTLAIGYGYLLDSRALADIDSSDEETMKKFLGKNTSVLYLSYEHVETFYRDRGKYKNVLLITAWNRMSHGFSHYLIFTDTFISDGRLGKTIPSPSLPDVALDREMDLLMSNLTDYGPSKRSVQCPVPIDETPTWNIIVSDE